MVNWHNMTIAVAGLLEFERLCERRTFIDESEFRRSCVEFIQATTTLELTPEYDHGDLPGRKRLDLVGRKKRGGTLALAVEAKWIKSGGGTRSWLIEVAEAALRLERISDETNQHTERALLVGGISQTVEAKLINREVNVGGGRRKAFRHFLQTLGEGDTFPYNQRKIEVRDSEDDFSKFFLGNVDKVGGTLPVSYQSSLADHHKAGPKINSIEVYAWVIRRSRNRSDYSPKEAV